MFISGPISHWRGVNNLEVLLKTGAIAWTGSILGARSDETTISLEARLADGSGGRLEETNRGSRSHKYWMGVKNSEVLLKMV